MVAAAGFSDVDHTSINGFGANGFKENGFR